MKNNNILVYVIVIILLICFAVYTYNVRQDRIQTWAQQNHYTVVDKETYWTIIGTPFNYCGKGQSIYKLTVRNSQNQTEVWYVRTGMFYNEYSK